MRIIYFDIDSLRRDHLGCYGYARPTSPNIDRIAEQGVRFNRYHCASSPCVPSRTGFTSGRFGIRNGVCSNHGAGAQFRIENNPYLGPKAENDMFPRQLRKHGYDTFGFSNFADRHCALWFMTGWTEFHTPNLKGGEETAEEVNATVLPWLQKNATREDYYLHINYWDPHRCYKIPESWADRFKDHPVPQAWPDEETIAKQQDDPGPFTTHGQYHNDISPDPLMPGAINNRKDFEHMITGYDATIAYADYHVGQVLEELDRQGVLEDSVIIISADHGDAFGEHGIYSDHVCADACIHNVPLIVKWPGVTKPNTEDSSLLYNVDFAPTICDMLDMPAPEHWDGESFRGNLEGAGGLDRPHLVWDTALYTVQRAVRTKTHLMIRTYDNMGYRMNPVELYNLAEDPYQANEISEENPDIVDECQRIMDDWVEEQKAKPNFVADPLEAVLEERRG